MAKIASFYFAGYNHAQEQEKFEGAHDWLEQLDLCIVGGITCNQTTLINTQPVIFNCFH